MSTQTPAGVKRTPPAKRRAIPWPVDVRDQALDKLRAGATVAVTARATGVPRSTLSKWARAAGIDVNAATHRTANATAARAAQLNAATTTRLEYLIELASTSLIRRLEANADVAELHPDTLGDWSEELGRFLPPEGSAAHAAMRRYAHVATGEATRDLVAALSRAVHDLAHLRDDAVDSGPLIVKFGIPRPVEPDVILRNVKVNT